MPAGTLVNGLNKKRQWFSCVTGFIGATGSKFITKKRKFDTLFRLVHTLGVIYNQAMKQWIAAEVHHLKGFMDITNHVSRI